MKFHAVLAAALFLAATCFAQTALNSRSYLDTSSNVITGTEGPVYSSVFILSALENPVGIIYTDDSSSAGFASDSILVEWGYQTGYLTVDSAGDLDTAWSVLHVLDTVNGLDSAGVQRKATVGLDGTYTAADINGCDTLQVPGYCVQIRPFTPWWGTLVRFWATGLTGNRAADDMIVRWQLGQRVAARVRDN